MADPLDGSGHECFVHIICIILKTKKGKRKGVGLQYYPKVGRTTNDKLAQQGLPIFNGNEIPQKACLGDLYLRAIIGTNNKSGIVWGEQVLYESRNYQISSKKLYQRRTGAACEMERM